MPQRPIYSCFMILYGFKGSLLSTTTLPGAACPACNSFNTVQTSVYSQYAHAYYIPFFPFSKKAVTQCASCQQGWEEKSLPPQLQSAVKTAKKSTRFPLWQWAGVGVLVVGLAWAAVAGQRHEHDRKAWLAAPHAGDLYTVHSPGDSTKFSLLKVVSAHGNTVEVVANEFEIDSSDPVSELNAPAKYSKESESLTQLDLQIMHNKGQLTDVTRLD
ncbi:MAG: hypothetical protein M3Y54_01660 [Bacteroidota bacterium]|nr:hypothetical protein [Bacteroidota bacterium]